MATSHTDASGRTGPGPLERFNAWFETAGVPSLLWLCVTGVAAVNQRRGDTALWATAAFLVLAALTLVAAWRSRNRPDAGWVVLSTAAVTFLAYVVLRG